jgi:ribonuclease T2
MTLWLRTLAWAVLCLSFLGSSPWARDGKGGTRFILAASWQPAFCATNQTKSECRDQTADRFDAENFSLHGLWPMRLEYCDVPDDQQQADRNSNWASLPEVALSADTRNTLAKAMPGTRSGLERHEWIKHGTCTGMTADDYFNRAAALLAELNASAVRDLFAKNIGRTLDADSIKAAFDESFGEGAGDRVKISCRRVGNQRVITELTIGLSLDATATGQTGPQLERLIQGAGRTSFGCDKGVVEAAGR